MNNGEFYQSREHNYIGENKRYPAELYIIPAEDNPLGGEISPSAPETKTIEAKKAPTKKARDNTKTVVDKLFGSIKGVATATVAVSAVVVAGTVAAINPTVELTNIDVGSSYVEYEIEVTDSVDDCYMILTTAGETVYEEEVVGDGVHSARIEGLKPAWEYTLSYVSRDEVLGELPHFRYTLQTKANSPPEVTDLTPVGTNILRVSLDSDYAEDVILFLEYGDGSTEERPLTEDELLRGYVDISVPEGITSLTVTPATFINDTLHSGKAISRDFGGALELDMMVGLGDYSKYITFYVKALLGNSFLLYVAPESDLSAGTTCFIDDGMAKFYYTEEAPVTYVAYLTDDSGERLSDEIRMTIDTTPLETTSEYTMKYSSPSEIGVTYNEDGTANVYVYTGFSSLDESYYCLVTLGEYSVKTQSEIAVFKSIPNESYPINYDICFDKDGVRYSIYNVYPSGAVNERMFSESVSLTDNEVSLVVRQNHVLDLNSIRLISSSGEVRLLTEADFTVGADDYLTAYALFDTPPDYVTLYVNMSPHTEGLEKIGEYDGSIYTPYEKIVYP